MSLRDNMFYWIPASAGMGLGERLSPIASAGLGLGERLSSIASAGMGRGEYHSRILRTTPAEAGVQ